MPLTNRKISSNLKLTDRVAILLGTFLLLAQQTSLTALAQASPELKIDRIFRYDSSFPGSNIQDRGLVSSLKQWLGAYQRTLPQGDNYVAIFDRASIPLKVTFKDSGDIENFIFGCPATKSLSFSEAPPELQKYLSKCTKFN